MSDFVKDKTSLPTNKSNARVAKVPAQQAVSATEWNDLAAAALSLRANRDLQGIYAEDYEYLITDPDDNYAQLQAAYDAAQAANKPLYLEPAKTYKVKTELNWGGGGTDNYIRVHGRNCIIRANGTQWDPATGLGQRSAVHVGVGLYLDNIQFQGQLISQYAAYFDGSNRARVVLCDFLQGFQDGANLGKTGAGTDSMHFVNCTCRLNGCLYHSAAFDGFSYGGHKVSVAGTVATTAGATTIVGTGTSFTQYGIREGDFIAIANASATDVQDVSTEWYMIASVVDDTHLTIYNLPQLASNLSGKNFAITVGWGLRQEITNEGNNCLWNELYCANNANGLRMASLYGGTLNHPQLDANAGFPLAIGAASSGQPIGMHVSHLYAEYQNTPAAIYVSGANSLVITDSIVAGELFMISNSNLVSGVSMGQGPFSDPSTGGIRPISPNTVSLVPSQVVGLDAQLWGRLRGRGYLAYSVPGGGSIQIAENRAVTSEYISGVSWYGDNAAHASHGFDTDAAVDNGVANVDLLTKHLMRFRNNAVFKAGVGVEGDWRTTSSDSSGTPGAATIDKPSGRFALATGAASVTITNALCTATTKVFLSKLDNDATAKDFKVTPGAGSFTVTPAVVSTAAVKFDFFLVNVGA